MVTITESKIMSPDDGTRLLYAFTGLSTDTKPTMDGSMKVGNGSTFIAMDTGAVFFFDEENSTWEEA